MEENNQTAPKKRIVIYADLELESDWTRFGNGANNTAIAKALLAIAVKHEEAPFGICKPLAERTPEERKRHRYGAK
jgi:hypothetical protein